jgi:hypothetical protein
MEEKDLIEQIKALKAVKPDEKWVFSTKMTILSGLMAQERGLNPTFASFLTGRSMKLTYSLVVLAMCVGGFTAFAKNSLPGNPLYAFKLSAQNTMVAVAPKSIRTNLKLAFTQAKITDLQKVSNSQMAETIAQGVVADLNSVSAEIKTETNPKLALSVSKSVKTQTEKMLTSLSTAPSKSQVAVATITDSVNKTDAQAYAIMVESQDKIDFCPSYISDEFELIKLYVAKVEPTGDTYTDLNNRLSLANSSISSKSPDHCIDGLVILDKLIADYKITLTPSASSGQVLTTTTIPGTTTVTTVPVTSSTSIHATTVSTSPVTTK